MHWSLLQDLDPSTRWTPRQALQHPFITQQRFTGPFQPAPAQQERGQPMRGQPGRPGASPYDSSMSSMYHSPMAAMLATSPEFHAQAHAAAMAALQVRLVYCPRSCPIDLMLSQKTAEQSSPALDARLVASLRLLRRVPSAKGIERISWQLASFLLQASFSSSPCRALQLAAELAC